MELEGRVTNVTNFGAFVDLGVHQDGLVHISELSHKYIQDAREAVKVGDVVKVKVIGVDQGMKRISLSMKALLPKPPRPPRRKKGKPEQRPVVAAAAPDCSGSRVLRGLLALLEVDPAAKESRSAMPGLRNRVLRALRDRKASSGHNTSAETPGGTHHARASLDDGRDDPGASGEIQWDEIEPKTHLTGSSAIPS